MKNMANFLILMIVTFGLSCNKNETDLTVSDEADSTNVTECQWSLIEPIPINDSLAQKLDKLFSDGNTFISGTDDTTLFVINTVEELNEICSETLDDYIGMDTVTIVGVKLLTSSISDTISSVSLFQCNDINKFKFETTVNHCVHCWTALGNKYAWQVFQNFPANSNYSLIIK